MKFNTEQRNAIYGEEPLIVVSAGAGSGKTRVLTERYVRVCELKLQSNLGISSGEEIGAEASEIVTLTFTEDAALEMKNRIRKKLMEKLEHVEIDYPIHFEEARSYWKKQIESMDTAIISTFHSFCQRMIQENSFEANIHPSFEVLDDVGSMVIKSEIYTELIEEAQNTGKWISLLESMNKWSLQDSLFSVYGKVREYELGSSLKEVLHVDALVRSWREKVTKLFQEFEQSYIRFFQSNPDISKLTAANKKHYHALFDSFQKNLQGSALVKDLKRNLANLKNTVPKNMAKQNQELFALLNKWLVVRELISYPLMEAVLLEFVELLLTFDKLYEQKKREASTFDFSDLQQKAILLMNDTGVQRYYSSMFKHFLVDEMQDTNQLQLRMIEKMRPRYRFIVGDGKQSIYRFRGADVEIFNGLINEAKNDSQFAFIDMNTNYRTCDSIIQFINLFFEQEHVMGDDHSASDERYKTPYSPMTAFRNEHRALQKRCEYIKVSEEQQKSQDENEYVMIARRMVQLLNEKAEVFDNDAGIWRTVEWRDMAVLMASRTNLTTLEMALKEYDIPYNVYGGLGFYERQEVVDFISLLQWVNKPYEMLYMMAVLRSPLFGVTMDEFLEIQHSLNEDETFSGFIYEKRFRKLEHSELKDKLEKFCGLFEKCTPFQWTGSNQDQLMDLFEDSGLKKVLLLQKNNLMKIKNVEKVIETITNLGAVSMDKMLEQLKILTDLSKKEGDAEVELTGGNFVHIMTVHGSKGLEFPVVYVPNLSREIQPDRNAFRYDVERGISVTFQAEDDEDLLAEPATVSSPNFNEVKDLSRNQGIEESKRLFYVALTRARDWLILTSKDKGNKNTWYSWLEEALTNSEQLRKLVDIKDGIPEQKAVVEKREIYEGPTVKLERSIHISFSVSEVISFMDDREGFIEKHLLKLDEAWLKEPEISDEFLIDEKIVDDNVQSFVDPRILGTLVHRICELLDTGYSEKDAYREAFTLVDQGEKDEYLDRVRLLIQSYQDKDFGQAVENEWQFVLEIDGIQVIGEIDKVVKKDDGSLEVLDLKTNYVRGNIEELIDYYRPQLYLYKMAYENEMQVDVSKMGLVFLRDMEQGVYEIGYDQSFEDRVREAVREMAKLKRKFVLGL